MAIINPLETELYIASIDPKYGTSALRKDGCI